MVPDLRVQCPQCLSSLIGSGVLAFECSRVAGTRAKHARHDGLFAGVPRTSPPDWASAGGNGTSLNRYRPKKKIHRICAEAISDRLFTTGPITAEEPENPLPGRSPAAQYR
jgi:hypothetical protein